MSEAILSIIASCALLVLSQLSPGPDIFYVLRTALARGYRAAIAVATGINIGFCIQAIIVCTVGTRIAEQSWSCWVLAAAGLWMLHLARCIMPPDRIRRHLRERREQRERLSACTAPVTCTPEGSVGHAVSAGAEDMAEAEGHALRSNAREDLSSAEACALGGEAALPGAETPGEPGEFGEPGGFGEFDAHGAGAEEDIPESLPRLLLRGFLCNILNVKCMLFIAGISISAVTRYSPQFPWFTPALIIAMLVAAQCGWMLWSGLMQLPTLRRLYARGSFAIDAAFAVLLCLFGLALFIPLAEAGLSLIF